MDRQTEDRLRTIIATEAAITLMEGETLDAFRTAIDAAASRVALDFCVTAAMASGWDPEAEGEGMEDPDFRAYTEDVAPDVVAVRVCREHPWATMYLRMPWTRASDGTFAFGAPTIVTPRTVYDEAPDQAAALGTFVTTVPGTEATQAEVPARDIAAEAIAAAESLRAMARECVAGKPIKAAELATVQRAAEALIVEHAAHDAVVKLARVNSAMRAGSIFDVAQGKV